MAESGKKESFAGNVMKYSVATYLGFGISGAALIVKGVLPSESYAVPASFMAHTTALMNVGMLGLDQGLLRFYHDPPAGTTGRRMFAACTRLSLLVMLLMGGIGSAFWAAPLAEALGLGGSAMLVPLLFLNAALYMLVRYLNVLLRLENNVRAYTSETLWMQACLNLIYLLPGFFTQSPLAFVLAAVASFGGVALFYWMRAGVSRTPGHAPVRGLKPYADIYRAALPYSIVLAPAAILIPLYRAICLSFLGIYTPAAQQGAFDFAYTLAQLVTTVQAGFSTYWGPYVYAHYRTEQERIGRMHDLLNFLIFAFFCVLVMFEDIIFWIFPSKADCQAYFPLMMLAVVFSILCEGTVYGNTIARRPYHDTIGTAVGLAVSLAVCLALVPNFGVMGAAAGLTAANAAMFLYRTITGQHYYRTIPSYSRTVCGFLLAAAVAGIGVVFAGKFMVKFALTGAILFVYCNIYRVQLARLWQLGMGLARKYLIRKP